LKYAEQEYAQASVKDLRPHPKNPRQGDVGAIHESIEANGFYGAIVAQKGTGYILAGNHRYKAAVQSGAKQVPVIWLDVDEATATRVLLADNRTNDRASYDNAALAEILAELAAGPGLEGTGYDGDDLDALIADLGGEPQKQVPDAPEAQIDRADELLQEWGVERGQLWIAGNHRILCGDSTNEADVSRLMDGKKAVLMVTDPPYGVEYDPQWRQDAASKGLLSCAERSVGKVASDDRSDWSEAFGMFDSQVAYVFHAGKFSSTVQAGLERSGFEIVSQIIWAKPTFAISRGDYHWQHEPCWYAVKKGKNHNWQGSRSESTLWQIERGCGGKTGHGTEKPIECMAKPIRNNTKKGESVCDPFLGSGTTICACEQLGRIGYGMEIEPKYVAVTLQRLKDMGLEPRLANA
jgi:DNA modification methylase